jgi:hypothetical protein
MEFNLIQAPEILLRLARAFGMRQAHIAPTLNEGVQAVVIIGDVSADPVTFSIGTYRFSTTNIFAGANVFMSSQLQNPIGSKVNLRVHAIQFSSNQGVEFALSGQPLTTPPGTTAIQTNPITVPFAAPVRSSVADVQVKAGVAVQLSREWGVYEVLVATTVEIRPENMVIPPGTALAVGNVTVGNVGSAMLTVLEWSEEPITGPLNR